MTMMLRVESCGMEVVPVSNTNDRTSNSNHKTLNEHNSSFYISRFMKNKFVSQDCTGAWWHSGPSTNLRAQVSEIIPCAQNKSYLKFACVFMSHSSRHWPLQCRIRRWYVRWRRRRTKRDWWSWRWYPWRWQRWYSGRSKPQHPHFDNCFSSWLSTNWNCRNRRCCHPTWSRSINESNETYPTWPWNETKCIYSKNNRCPHHGECALKAFLECCCIHSLALT